MKRIVQTAEKWKQKNLKEEKKRKKMRKKKIPQFRVLIPILKIKDQPNNKQTQIQMNPGSRFITKPILSSIEKIQPYLNGSVDKVTEFIEALNSHIAACNQSLEAAMGLTKSSAAEATATA